jgi:hypothetical protein
MFRVFCETVDGTTSTYKAKPTGFASELPTLQTTQGLGGTQSGGRTGKDIKPLHPPGGLRYECAWGHCVTLFYSLQIATAGGRLDPSMLFSKEYVGYLAREVTKRLIAGKFIETEKVPVVTERVNAALVDELSLEDRINDEVRVILEAYSDEMNRSGANYQEMFRKVKSELVRKYKAVL